MGGRLELCCLSLRHARFVAQATKAMTITSRTYSTECMACLKRSIGCSRNFEQVKTLGRKNWTRPMRTNVQRETKMPLRPKRKEVEAMKKMLRGGDATAGTTGEMTGAMIGEMTDEVIEIDETIGGKTGGIAAKIGAEAGGA